MEVDLEELNAVRSDYALLTTEERLFLELRQLPNIRLVLPEKENENSAENDDRAAAAAGASNNHGEDAMDIDYDSKYRCPSSSPETHQQQQQQQQLATERTTTTTTTTSLPANVTLKRAKLKVRKTVEDL